MKYIIVLYCPLYLKRITIKEQIDIAEYSCIAFVVCLYLGQTEAVCSCSAIHFEYIVSALCCLPACDFGLLSSENFL